jgi:hypothetical protein
MCKIWYKESMACINEILNRKKKKHTLTETFYINNQQISDPLLIANNFFKYF